MSNAEPAHVRAFRESPHASIGLDFIDGRVTVAQPAFSPDGAHVAYVVATASVGENKPTVRVWLDDQPVTAGPVDTNPTWSPDGRHLAFTSRRGEGPGEATLHVLPVGVPGEVRTVATMPDGIDSPQWSPDGRWLAFTSRTRDARYEAPDDSWRSPRKVERFFSRLNGENWVFDRPSHVHVVAADGTVPVRNLTPGAHEHGGVAWTADSSAVVTTASRHDTWDTDLATDLYLVPLEVDAEPRCLTGHDLNCAYPVVSPDGTRVAFVGIHDLRSLAANARIGVIPLDADGASVDDVTWASLDLDRTFGVLTGQGPVWLDDDHLVAVAEDRGEQHAYLLTADGSQSPRALTSGAKVVAQFDVTGGLGAGGHPARLATVETTIERPAELHLDGERVTAGADAMAARAFSCEKFAAPTTDGSGEIDAWIMRPADFDPEQTYPVLLNVHGGPFTQYGEFFFDEAQMQAAAGFVVVFGNPRGSSGRDTEWGQAILGPKHPVTPGTGWGSVDVEDVLAILDTALDRYPFCDRDRVGMLGGSYGGFMATTLAGRHGDRFRAFCSERAVNNLPALEHNSDIATVFVVEHGLSHLEDPEEYSARSPMRWVNDIDKPMLLIHSEEDWRTPINQAEELWIALKLLGKEVDFYRFPGENHELSRSGSAIHRVQRAEIILDWFAEKLAAETPADDGAAAGPA
ncbi:MAG: S9 family peptidase [Actinomycetota bacterium]